MKVQVFPSIQSLSEESWNRLAPPDFPFMSYHFLSALETTDCLGTRTGWEPLYVTVWDQTNLIGAALTFMKYNSYGEYIFDFAWAEAHERFGIDYYPKLVSAVPFTPATGPKILFAPELSASQQEAVLGLLLAEIEVKRGQLGLSSAHLLFIPASQTSAVEKAGFFVRHSFQYHWRNQGYRTFQDFLGNLTSKRRREILRERTQVTDSSIRIERLTGKELTKEHGQIFYRFYADTVHKMGGFDYLTPALFTQVFQTMKDNLLFVLARNPEGVPVAGALNYFGDRTLYGRHWGCTEEYKSLHFELCYYQGIEFAIERGLTLFEAGAQGEHKFQRGFLPSLTYSAHRVQNPKLDAAIRDFVEREKMQLQDLFAQYQAHTPFKQSPDPTP